MIRSSVGASTGVRCSRSARTIICCWAMMRVLIVVGRDLSAINKSSVWKVLFSLTELRILSPAKSSPTTPITHACAPSASRLANTFAAPPRCVDSRLMSTTGTGASGEMRVTSPQRNSSSITSPSTTMLRSRIRRVISSARVLGTACIPTKESFTQRRKDNLAAQHSINRAHYSFNGHSQNALGLFKLSTEIAVAWLAGHLFQHDFVCLGSPGPPMRNI